MPVVGRVDDDRVDVLHVEQPAVVAVPRGLASGLSRGKIHVGLVDVAQGDDLGVLVREKGVEHLVAAVAQADEAQPHPVVGASHASRAGGR